MKKCIKSELFILLNRRQFKFIFAVSLSLSLLSFLLNVITYYGQYIADVKSFRDICLLSSNNPISSIFIMALPILSVAAFCDIYIDDKKNNRLSIIFQKCKRSEYYYSGFIISALSPVFTVCIPVLLNLLLCTAAFPGFSAAELTGLASNQAYLYSAESEYMTMLLFKKLFILHPFIYSFLFVLFMTLYACAGAALTYSLSYFIKNRGMIIVPFFVFNLMTNICRSVIFERFKISVSVSDYILSEIATEGINYGVFFAIIIIMLVLAITLSKINLSKLGDVI